MTKTTPTSPPKFEGAGTALWGRVMADFVLDPAEESLLVQACRTLDELTRLTEALESADLVVEGSKGQPVPSPLLGQVREHRRVLDALCRSLALPVEGAQTGSRRDPQRSKAAASGHRGTKLRSMRGSA